MFNRLATRFAYSFFALLFIPSAQAADEVSRQAPDGYAERFAPLLTSADEALKHKVDFTDSEANVAGLLYETLRWLQPDGRVVLVIHKIELARNEEGANDLGKESMPFRKSDVKPYLVLARAIQPDGRSQPAAANAVFIQSPQPEADSSLFSDYSEVVVLYPNIKPGTARESIFVLDEQTSRTPGEFTGILQFAAYRPESHMRHVIDVDEALAARLTLTPIGQGTPEPKREVQPNKRIRFTWDREHIAKIPWEQDRAPMGQVGPVVCLTTFKSWDAVGTWYSKLLVGRDRAKGVLAEQVAESTKNTTDRDAIIAKLYKQAAKEVRYTGLEFGTAGLQPYDPNDVWGNRYGDCKDKANLLRVMLREKGILAYLAFVNTDNAGRVEKASPSLRQFNHVILALPQTDAAGKTAYLFCDPTIKYGQPGMLRPDDSNRDVLLLKEVAGAVVTEFVHTPDADGGLVSYDFDLHLDAAGEMSGWLTLEAKEYAGTSWAEFMSGKNREDARDRMLSVVQQFYRNAQVIDIETMPSDKFAGDYKLRLYFIVPASGSGNRVRDTLTFPNADFFLPEFGDTKSRQTLYWQTRESRTVQSKIQLPPGWAADDLPQPFEVNAGSLIASAGWEGAGEQLASHYECRMMQSQVLPAQYPKLHTAVTSLRAWTSKPLAISLHSTGAAPRIAVTPTTRPALDFPLMASGEGQMELLDRKFPLSRNAAERREALLKVLQWFPNDKTTRFIADVRLAEIELQTKPDDTAVLDRVRRLLTTSKNQVEASYLAWGEYMFADWLRDADRKPEAQATFVRLANDTTLSAYRRSWSAIEAAQMLRADHPDQASAILESILPLESSAQPTAYSRLADLLLTQKQGPKLAEKLEALSKLSTERTEKVLAELLDDINHADEAEHAKALELLGIIETVIGHNTELTNLRDDVATARSHFDQLAGQIRIVDTLRTYLASKPPAWWKTTPLDSSIKTRTQFQKAIKKTGDESAVEPYIKTLLEYVLRLPPDGEDFSKSIWQAASSLHSHQQDEPLLLHLLNLLDQLPETDRYYFEGQFIRVERLMAHDKDAEVLTMLKAISINPKAPPATQHGALRRAAELLERRHKYPEALAMYREMEPNPAANRRSSDALLRSVFINLNLGQTEDALRTVGVLAKLDTATLDSADAVAEINDVIALARDPKAAEAFWKRQETWWPLWLKLESDLGINQPASNIDVPIITDAAEPEKEMNAAVRANDRRRFFTAIRRVAQAARWQPRWVVELAAAHNLIIHFAPEQEKQLHALLIAALEGLKSDDVVIARRVKLYLAIHLYDSGRVAETFPVIRDFQATNKINDYTSQAVHRVWALAALNRKQDIDAAITAMEGDLATDFSTNRAHTVSRLADLYRNRGRTEDEVSMLNRELTNSSVQAETETFAQLKKRLEAMSSGEDLVPAKFSQTVTAWLKENKPAWYDFARPARLEETTVRDIDAFLQQPPADMLAAEVVKVELLLAQAPAQPYAKRLAAFEAAIDKIALIETRTSTILKLYASVYSHPGFPESTRRLFLWRAMCDSYTPAATIKVLQSHPLYKTYSEVDHARIEAVLAYRSIDEDSAPVVEAYLLRLIEHPLNTNEVDGLNSAFYRLIHLDPQAAKRVYDATAKITFSTDSPVPGGTPVSLRLGLLKKMRAIERFAAADRFARDLCQKRVDKMQVPPPPPNWKEFRDNDYLSWLDSRSDLGYRAHLLQTHRYNTGSYFSWSDLLRAIDKDENDLEFISTFFEGYLSRLPDDETQSHCIYGLTFFFDIDDAAHRAKILTILQPYRDAAKYPLSLSEIKLMDVRFAMRNGTAVDIETAFNGIQNSRRASTARRAKIVHYLSANNIPALKRYLETLSPDQLFDVDYLPGTIQGLQASGMVDEMALVRDEAIKELYRCVLRSWCDMDKGDMLAALKLAQLLDAKDQLPQAWIDECMSRMQNLDVRYRMTAALAELRQDWPAMAAAANDAIHQHPRLYPNYYTKACALEHLGQKSQAIEAIKVYLAHSGDEIQHAPALAMLKRLESK